MGGGENTASGAVSIVVGGANNIAGGDFSFAAGLQAKAEHNGTFVWADSNFNDVTSTATNQFVVGAQAGAHFLFDTDAGATTPGAGNNCSITEAGGLSCTSDRNSKENLAMQNGREVLEKLAGMPIYKWNFISDETATTHMGPMAQDFYASFEVGNSDLMISTIDLDGVSLAAIQGLYQLNQAQAGEIAALQEEISMNVSGPNSAQPSTSYPTWVWLAIGLFMAGMLYQQSQIMALKKMIA